jgi:hypothetical protein
VEGFIRFLGAGEEVSGSSCASNYVMPAAAGRKGHKLFGPQ